MRRPNPIDAAFRRGQMLTQILKWVREQALANPAQPRWADLGLTAAYETREKSVAELNAAFDQLFGLLEHLAVLDMAASFEIASQRRITTRIGEARSALNESAKRGRSAPHLDKLLRGSGDYESLKSFEDLIAGYADRGMVEAFALVRAARNNFAHGTDILSAPVIDRERARDNLKDVLDRI